jgi:hypothetical protein
MSSRAKKKNKKKEDYVWVVSHGGAKTKVEFEHGEFLGRQEDGNIRKAPHPPPKFDVVQQK